MSDEKQFATSRSGESRFDPWPSIGVAAVAGAINGLYVAAGWTQLRGGRAMAASTFVGAVAAAVAEAARISSGGQQDVSKTLGVASVAGIGAVFAGLAATTPKGTPGVGLLGSGRIAAEVK